MTVRTLKHRSRERSHRENEDARVYFSHFHLLLSFRWILTRIVTSGLVVIDTVYLKFIMFVYEKPVEFRGRILRSNIN